MKSQILQVIFLLLLLGNEVKSQGEPMSGEQIGRMMPRVVDNMISRLTFDGLLNVVRFVIGPTALPSNQMMQWAMTQRRAPRTRAERDVYLGMMMDVARSTPKFLEKFISWKTINGTKIMVLNDITMNAHITRKGLEYNELMDAKAAREQKKAAEEKAHQNNLNSIIGPVDIFGNPVVDNMGYDTFMDPLLPTTPIPQVGSAVQAKPVQKPSQVANGGNKVAVPSTASPIVQTTSLFDQMFNGVGNGPTTGFGFF